MARWACCGHVNPPLHALSSATVAGLAAAVACFEAAATLPFSEGAAVEARLHNACRVSPNPVDMADKIGLATIVERLAHEARQRGNAHGYWNASALLKERASSGQRLMLSLSGLHAPELPFHKRKPIHVF